MLSIWEIKPVFFGIFYVIQTLLFLDISRSNFLIWNFVNYSRVVDDLSAILVRKFESFEDENSGHSMVGYTLNCLSNEEEFGQFSTC